MSGRRWQALGAGALVALLASQILAYAALAWENRSVWRMQDLLGASMCSQPPTPQR